ncbi:molecular chaperone GrpE [Caproiciproducens faecalis]|uniref:Molecular chaperone GrpE n=1 Tax=Caproiciproducens faecalis TaxID=2820301 RepID=A0ABS7DPF3_9FIRM|nr:molecular chaperone GrpE [Caproiciproducens faecalis]MBW7573195.1 molecular chaperone GrpE [Caproiciproducens faecalis]
MSTQQRDEIETIKERNISIKLSDADVERLCNKTGESGLTVSELFQNFVGDLVDGTYSNGSDERMYANQWFDRCWFGMGFGETSFLQWLITNESVSDAIEEWIDLQSYGEQEDLDEDDLEDVGFIKENLNELFEGYKGERGASQDSTLENEMEKVMQWHDEMTKIMNSKKELTSDTSSKLEEANHVDCKTLSGIVQKECSTNSHAPSNEPSMDFDEGPEMEM